MCKVTRHKQCAFLTYMFVHTNTHRHTKKKYISFLCKRELRMVLSYLTIVQHFKVYILTPLVLRTAQ